MNLRARYNARKDVLASQEGLCSMKLVNLDRQTDRQTDRQKERKKERKRKKEIKLVN